MRLGTSHVAVRPKGTAIRPRGVPPVWWSQITVSTEAGALRTARHPSLCALTLGAVSCSRHARQTVRRRARRALRSATRVLRRRALQAMVDAPAAASALSVRDARRRRRRVRCATHCRAARRARGRGAGLSMKPISPRDRAGPRAARRCEVPSVCQSTSRCRAGRGRGRRRRRPFWVMQLVCVQSVPTSLSVVEMCPRRS